jgi:glycerol-3-phosphate cytidylyltransferase-like family protein
MNAPITLADGVFDPLHDRHVAYVQMAGLIDPACDLVVQVSRQTKRPEFLSRAARVRVVRGLDSVSRAVEYTSTLEALALLRPRHYVKGYDWQLRGLPAEEQAYCDAHGVQVHFVDTGETRSSTALLRAWADLEAWRGLREFDADALVQRQVEFNAIAQGYTDYGARVAIEAKHPDILAGLCHRKTVLDVGCGPGHLVQMLRERGVEASGIDPYLPPRYQHCKLGTAAQVPAGVRYDVVICREVLEHVPVREWGALLHHLFRVAKERVYLTTRFTQAPAHPFELGDELAVDPSHITTLPQPFVRALCVAQGGHRDHVWESALDWQHKQRALVYQVPR